MTMRVMQELTGVFPLSLWERARERDYAAALSLTIARKRLCDLQSRLRERIKKYFAQLSPLPRPFSQGEKGGLHRNSFAQFAFVLLCAGGLKFFYSTTSVNQLRWILAPTTALVELISGQSFQFESHAGYINSDHSFLIAASCAGVNFLITAFLMLALGHLWRNRSQRLSWKFVPYAALIAYLVTLVANTVRITTALQLRAMRVESGLLSPGQLHRFEGIFIYFGFLLLLYVISDFLSSAASPTAAEPGVTRKCLAGNTGALIFRTQTRAVALQSLNAEARQRRPVTLQRCLFPLVIYYGTTLGIPFLNGAFRQADFWEHSAFVLLIPLVFVIPFAGFVFLRRISRAIKLS